MKARRYKHNLGHYRNTTFNMGTWTPIGCMPVTRGDTFKHNTSAFMRVNTLVHPVMHPVNVNIEHYYVPNSIVWENAREFLSGGEDFDDASSHPYIDFSGSPVTKGSLANHLGLPVGYNRNANALPFRAHNLIYNERKRDDQLQAKVALALTDGADTTTDTDLLNVNWGKDPYTSARPDDQLGTDVTVPIAGDAPVTGIGHIDGTYPHGSVNVRETDGSGTTNYAASQHTATSAQVYLEEDPNNAGYPNIRALLSAATGIPLSDLALAIQQGKLQEAMSRNGNDYHDFLSRHGIKYSDGRLGRPEYLGGGSNMVQFSEVLSTSESGTQKVGDMAGHGIAAMKSNNYMRFFEEDGFILSFMSVRPRTMYMEGVNKFWLFNDRSDYYQKEYEAIGMEEIENQEVQYNHSTPEGTFGYRPRYDYFRRMPSTVHGEFADLDKDWHYARTFTGDQALNSAFITCEPTNRVYADTTQDQLKCTVQHKVKKLSLIKAKAPTISLT